MNCSRVFRRLLGKILFVLPLMAACSQDEGGQAFDDMPDVSWDGSDASDAVIDGEDSHCDVSICDGQPTDGFRNTDEGTEDVCICGPEALSATLNLSETDVSVGEKITIGVLVANRCCQSLSLKNLRVIVQSESEKKRETLYEHGPLTLEASSTISVSASRLFEDVDSTGLWIVRVSYEDDSGWHELSQVAQFVVSPSGSTFDGWRLMTVRSKGEFDRGEPGGRAEQYMQGGARCLSNPDIVYLNHDCSTVWRSIDGGRTWEKPLAIGAYLTQGQSLEVDPVNCNRVVAILDTNDGYWNSNLTGIYLSEDGGDHWLHVAATATRHSRRYEHNLAWAPSSRDSTGAKRWYAAIHEEKGSDDSALYVSDDYGKSWQKKVVLAGLTPVYGIQVNPSNADEVLVASERGLRYTNNAGASLQKKGDLPAGAVTSIGYGPNDSKTIIAAVRAHGLFRSTDGGMRFEAVVSDDASVQLVLASAWGVFMSPVDGNQFYVTSKNANVHAVRTTDGGKSFTATSVSLPDDIAKQRWGKAFFGEFSFLLPSAKSFSDVIAQSGGAALYHSTNGVTFQNGSTYFDGANCGYGNHHVAFDRTNPDRIAFGYTDIGLYLTENRADWFQQRAVPLAWRSEDGASVDPATGCRVPKGRISRSAAMDVLDFQPGTETIVASAGRIGAQKLVYSTDSGKNWNFADERCATYERIVFHPTDTSRVFAGNKLSKDGGKSFTVMKFPADFPVNDMQVVDLCRANPDIVYAINQVPGMIARSMDRGESWTSYTKVAWPFSGPTWIAAVDPIDCDIVYTVDNRQDLARFDGTKWHSYNLRSLVNIPDNVRVGVRSFLVDPSHPDVMYAGFSTAGISSVLRSTDRGQSWKDVSYNRFRQGVWGFNISPHSGEVLVGDCSGTWVLAPPYETPKGMYSRLISRPSCFDGLRNGDEEGVDCGGRCAAVCL